VTPWYGLNLWCCCCCVGLCCCCCCCCCCCWGGGCCCCCFALRAFGDGICGAVYMKQNTATVKTTARRISVYTVRKYNCCCHYNTNISCHSTGSYVLASYHKNNQLHLQKDRAWLRWVWPVQHCGNWGSRLVSHVTQSHTIEHITDLNKGIIMGNNKRSKYQTKRFVTSQGSNAFLVLTSAQQSSFMRELHSFSKHMNIHTNSSNLAP